MKKNFNKNRIKRSKTKRISQFFEKFHSSDESQEEKSGEKLSLRTVETRSRLELKVKKKGKEGGVLKNYTPSKIASVFKNSPGVIF